MLRIGRSPRASPSLLRWAEAVLAPPAPPPLQLRAFRSLARPAGVLCTHARPTQLSSPLQSTTALALPSCTAVTNHASRRSLFGFGKPERVTLHERRLVPFPAAVYFDVVLDVDHYHEFVPFCSASRVTRRLGDGTMEAELTIGFRIFTEAYTSRIDYVRPNSIRIKSVQSSVFGHLISTWSFKPDPSNARQCYVEFDIDFEVSSPVHASAVKLFFTDVAERQIKAFSERCIKLFREGKLKGEVETPTPIAATPKPAAITSTATAMPSRAPVPATASTAPARASPAPATAAAAPAGSSFQYPPRAPAIATNGSSPVTLVSGAAALACPVPHIGRRVKFTASEIDKLRVVFLKHARAVANPAVPQPQPTQNSPPSLEQEFDHERFGEGHEAALAANNQPPEHLFASDGQELRLFIDGFSNLCTDVCMATGGVFGRFRERATLRSISDIGAAGLLTQGLFVADPHVYGCERIPPVSGSGSGGPLSSLVHQHPDGPESQLNSGSTAAALRSVPYSFSFGEFLAHFYYLTKATIEEKLLYILLVSARRKQLFGKETYERDQLAPVRAATVSPIPDVFDRRQNVSTVLSLSSLRSTTAAFFCMHVGVLRHIMPLMTYHRAREMREQLELQRQAMYHRQQARMRSPNAALLPPLPEPVLKPVDPAVTALALLGLLEGVLNEAETAIREVIDNMSKARSPACVTDTAADDPQQQQQQNAIVPIEQWVSEWSSQAELLALVSVPGLATLIQIHSVVPVEAYDAAKPMRVQEATGTIRSTAPLTE